MANAMPKTKAKNEPYRKVKITMWDDPKFRALSALPPSGQSLFIYLLTSPFTGIIPGLFKAGRAALAEELGWEVEAFDLALDEALALGMVKADMQARVFWLPNAAKHNPPASLNVVKSWVRAFELLPDCPLKWEARVSLRAVCYGVSKAMGEAFDKAIPLPKNKPSPLPSVIQKAVNSKQILKDQNTLVHGKETASEPVQDFLAADSPDYPKADPTVSSDAAKQIAPKNRTAGYPAEFEQAWCEYPGRAGANPKKSAFSAWHARRREGTSPEAMLDGIRRYVNFLQVTGKVGTEFVQRASTFFGPDRHFENSWSPPVSNASAQRVDRISPVDYEIPDGFRREL